MRLVFLALFVAIASASRISTGNPELDKEWTKFKVTYNKKYNLQEEAVRRLVWENNKAGVEKHNMEAAQGKHSFTLRENRFSDMTNEEFRQTMTGFKPAFTNRSEVQFSEKSLPSDVDWRKKGLVTPVKNQGQCGSCWAFSAVGSIEGQHAKATGNLVSLSEQQIVDCDTDEAGCNGGLMDNAFDYVIKAGGLESEKDYGYDAAQGQCHFDKSKVAATISSYKDVQHGSESELQQATATIGPISVAIDASHVSFQLYGEGVYYEPGCSTEQLDHGVLIVGYGTDNGQDYWIVKNSWGPSWGEQGYIRMSRNRNNNCGIATEASYPIV